MTHSKHISNHTKGELLALLDDLEEWEGKDYLRYTIQQAVDDRHAQKLFSIGVYGPFTSKLETLRAADRPHPETSQERIDRTWVCPRPQERYGRYG